MPKNVASRAHRLNQSLNERSIDQGLPQPDTLTNLKKHSIQNIHLPAVLNHQKNIKHRGAQVMRVTRLRCKSVPKDVTQCIIGGQQILDRASDKRLLLLVSKCNLIFVSADLRHSLKIRMRLSVERVWNNLSKLGKRG